jgi:hypothetical protein
MRGHRLQISSGRAWVLLCENSIVQERHLQGKGQSVRQFPSAPQWRAGPPLCNMLSPNGIALSTTEEQDEYILGQCSNSHWRALLTMLR